jgi:hypothetical protein
MEVVLSTINMWKDLIVKVFSEYPLAAAFVTAIGVAAYFWLEKKARPGKVLQNILMVLLGWAVAVPIVGLLLTIVGKIWGGIEATMPFLAKVLGSVYEIYSHHPYLVLVIIAIALIGYIAWSRWAPRRIPHRPVRAALVAVLAIVVIHIAGPIADQITPTKASADTPSKHTG